jgi:hypothetical protein
LRSKESLRFIQRLVGELRIVIKGVGQKGESGEGLLEAGMLDVTLLSSLGKIRSVFHGPVM